MTTGVKSVFLASVAAVFVFFAASVFYSLPSNVLSSRDDSGARHAVLVLADQQFGYFTKDQKGEQFVAYRLDPGTGNIRNVLSTPQNMSRNLFGLSRTQRAQGPELADIVNFNTITWTACSESARNCILQNRNMSPSHLRNRANFTSLCGDLFVLTEKVVDWNYRHLVDYPRLAVKIGHIDVQC